jgi:ATP-dependent HslUV protease subunit HslV
MTKVKSTTVIAIKHNGQVAIGADGQATMGNTVAKSNVRKIRKLQDGKIITGSPEAPLMLLHFLSALMRN